MLSEQLQNLLGKTSRFSGLYLNPDFQYWKAEIVDKRLENLKKNVLKSDPRSEDHIKFTLRYQELKYICEDIFKIMSVTEERLRKKDKSKEEV